MAALPPTLDVDPFSDQFLADPYPDHERMRVAGPVVWLETSAPQPPDRHSYRFERDWEYLSARLR